MLDSELEHATALALRAGELALEMSADLNDIQYKADDAGPVTAADKALNRLIVDSLKAAFPDDAVLGEESDLAGFDSKKRTWWVDPIDGTKDFIAQRPEWSVMIGLAVDGRAKLGVVYQPNSDRLFSGVVGRGAWLKTGDRPAADLRCSDLSDPRAATATLSRNHPDPHLEALMRELGMTRELPHSSIGMKLGLIADKQAHLYINVSGRCHLWDTCAGDAILSAAGGTLRTPGGGYLDYLAPNGTLIREPFIATTDALWPQVSDAFTATYNHNQS